MSGGTITNANITILPFDPAQFNNFAMWRADMQVMHEMQSRAQNFPCAATRSSQPIAVGVKGASVAALSYVPTGSGAFAGANSSRLGVVGGIGYAGRRNNPRSRVHGQGSQGALQPEHPHADAGTVRRTAQVSIPLRPVGVKCLICVVLC